MFIQSSRRRRTAARVLSAALLLLAGRAGAATYYVSASGRDSDTGLSAAHAWRTLSRVNAGRYAGGDRILLQGGRTFAGSLKFSPANTAAGSIFVGSSGTGRAVIQAGNGAGLTVVDRGGFTVQNLTLTGSGVGKNSADGILFLCDLPGGAKLDGVSVSGVEVSGFGGAGVSLSSGPADGSRSGFRHVRLSQIFAHDNSDGISSDGAFSATLPGYAHSDIVVSDCRAFRNFGQPGQGVSGNGIVLSDVDGATIERCIAWANGKYNGSVGIWAWESNRVTIQYNESYANRTQAATDADGFDLDGGVTNSVMQYNYSHDNDGDGYLVYEFNGARPHAHNIVRYNISQNDCRRNGFGALSTGNGVSDCQVYNNTVFLSPTAPSEPPPAAIKILAGTSGFAFRNNILQTTGGLSLVEVDDAADTRTNAFQGNDYWAGGQAFTVSWAGTRYASLASWRTATGQERVGQKATGLTVSPGLVSAGGGGILGDPAHPEKLTAYRLKPSSPLINAGLNLPTLFGLSVGAQDFYGTGIPQGGAYDIGAAEAAR